MRAATKQLVGELVEAVQYQCSIEQRHEDCEECGIPEGEDEWVPCPLGVKENEIGDRVERAIHAIIQALEAKETK